MKQLILGALVLSLAACSGGNSGGGVAVNPEAERPVPSGLLRPAESSEELLSHLREGLRRGYSQPQAVLFAEVEPVAADGAADSAGASSTTLQEVGVDEADLLKYDGENLYYFDWRWPQQGIAEDQLLPVYSPALVLQHYRTDPAQASATLVDEHTVDHAGDSVEGLYLYETNAGSRLWAISQSAQYYAYASFVAPQAWVDTGTWLQEYALDADGVPTEVVSIRVDGSLLSSRRIDNRLYLATRFSPFIPGIEPYGLLPEEAVLDDSIDELSEEELLPGIEIDGVRSTLVQAENCYVPNLDSAQGDMPPDSGLVTVLSIDLDNPQDVRSVCINAYASGFYASREAVYVTANSAADETVIHKLALLPEGPDYRGSGSVPGYIGTGSPSFLMSERNGDLRVFSSLWDNEPFPMPVFETDIETELEADAETASVGGEDLGRHRLTVLRESSDGQTLEQVAQIPNATAKQRLGKPGENIYAARFVDDRAYLVTFEVIDPLYAIDLSDPKSPQILGELEIPGFSTLLQPVGEDLLFGVGQEVADDGLALTQGIKLALFDVSDPTQPAVLDQTIIGKRGSYSPALYEHHALTLLQTDTGYRIALPIQRYDGEPQGEEPWEYYPWADSSLYLFELEAGAGTLRQSGRVIVEQAGPDQPYSNGLGSARSALHHDAVFFLTNGQLHSGVWGQESGT